VRWMCLPTTSTMKTMKINCIKPSQRKQGRILVKLEDESILQLNEVALLRFGLYEGMEIDERLREEIERFAAAEKTRESAAGMIGRRALSKKELQDRLVRKGADKQDAREAADWLEEIGAVDDANYAGVIARHYGSRGYGIARVKEELRRRGVDRSLWEEALAELPEGREAIAAYLAKRRPGDLNDPKELKRVTDSLVRRGFSWSDIRAAMGEYLTEFDD